MRANVLAAIAVVQLAAIPSGAQEIVEGRRGARYVLEATCPDNEPATFHRCALAAAPRFDDPPRTPYGHPDMGGAWWRQSGSHEDLEAHPPAPEDIGGPSTVVDPQDGKVPIQPWAEAKRLEFLGKYVHHTAACLPSGVPNAVTHGGMPYVMQSKDYLVVLNLGAHTSRIISLNGAPPVGEDIRLWKGDSRGYWDGNTLVVETTNQNAIPWLDQRYRFITDEARVVERYTLIDANTLHWQGTVDDPNVYTRPFTLALAFRRQVDGAPLLEAACYEGNAPGMELMVNAGFGYFPGISAEEARAARVAWEMEQ